MDYSKPILRQLREVLLQCQDGSSASVAIASCNTGGSPGAACTSGTSPQPQVGAFTCQGGTNAAGMATNVAESCKSTGSTASISVPGGLAVADYCDTGSGITLGNCATGTSA